MHHPNFRTELYGIDNTERITAERQNDRAISKTPDPIPCIGFAMWPCRPRQRRTGQRGKFDLAPSGNVSNSFSATLIHETSRVFRVIAAVAAWHYSVVIFDNRVSRQAAVLRSTALFSVGMAGCVSAEDS